MIILHANSEKDVEKIDKLVKNGKNVFILVFMEGCGPCNATRPEWAKLEDALKHQYSKNDKLAIIDVNKDYLSGIKSLGNVEGFPTIKYIGNYGKTVEPYENSSIKKKDRSVDSFINWIEYKINDMVSTTNTSSAQDVYDRIANKQTRNNKQTRKLHSKRRTKRRHKQHGGKKLIKRKWSNKYKLSINCNRPKGFSQKQYCKYGRH